MTHWVASGHFDSFHRAFGDIAAWTKGGDWFPVSGPSGMITAKLPDEQLTWEFIYAVKRDRRIGARQLAEREASAEEREDARIADELRMMIREDLPSLSLRPGCRGGDVLVFTEKGQKDA